MFHTQNSDRKASAGKGYSFSDRGIILKITLDICLRYIMPFVTLTIGVLLTLHLMRTGPEARPTQKDPSGFMVETTTVHYHRYPTVIQAMGTVTAAKSIELKSQVSGQILSISDNFIPGGKLATGDTLLQLDPSDYRLALEQQENQVIQAQNELDIEKGNQLVAQKEYALLNEQVSEEEMRLMLRQPQLSTLQTKLSIAKSQKEQAELNLSRTAIIAPFNGIVQSSNVNIGTWVSSGSVLAAMVGSDTYWVEVSVPEDQLDWVRLPVGNDGQGSKVKIFNTAAWEEEEFRDGRLIRLLPGLETKGRMARLLVEIDDPLALDTENNGKPKVMIGSFVRVEIEGRQIHRAVELPREYLRNGNQIWVYDETGRLAIQDVSIGFKNRDSVLITAGVKDGESIVISDISTPVEGLVLKTSNSGNPPASEPSENVAAIHGKTEPMIRGFENDE